MLAEDEHSVKTDFLVIGSGIAGLSYALKVAGHGRVLVLTKAQEEESNTKYAREALLRYGDTRIQLRNMLPIPLMQEQGCATEMW